MEAEKGNFTRFRNLRIPHPANINHAGCGTRGSATRKFNYSRYIMPLVALCAKLAGCGKRGSATRIPQV